LFEFKEVEEVKALVKVRFNDKEYDEDRHIEVATVKT
jgi:hypothetical protein